MERPRAKLLWDWGEIRAMRRWGQAPAAVGTGPGGGGDRPRGRWGQALAAVGTGPGGGGELVQSATEEGSEKDTSKWMTGQAKEAGVLEAQTIRIRWAR